MTYNLIWPEFGMHPLVRAGHSLREHAKAFLLPLSITNSKQFADSPSSADFNVKTLHPGFYLAFSPHRAQTFQPLILNLKRD